MNRLKQLHAYSVTTGTDRSKKLIVKLLRIPNIAYAHALFDQNPKPTVFLYNKLIHAYASRGPHHRCLTIYAQMRFQDLFPNNYTFTYLFSACATLVLPLQGRAFHSLFIKFGFEADVFASTALVDMYSKWGSLVDARHLFDEMPVKALPTWNSIIAGYAKHSDLKEACRLFDLMPSRNVVSWTTLISGYTQNGLYADALSIFWRMEEERIVMPNEVTVASILPACANLGALELGEKLEAYAKKNGYMNNFYVCSGLVDMFARCGKLEKARQVFNETGSRRNVFAWNVMIMGLATHGEFKEALEYFYEMQIEGIKPNHVTLIGALMACVHGGMIDSGEKLFESMEKKFNIVPRLEHYGCMVDLLGRAGKLVKAYDFIQDMPMKPDSVIWGSLLGACSFHGQVEIAKVAANHLFEIEPSNSGNYILLSNIYASAGEWDGVAELRKSMKGLQMKKAAGYSFIEEGGQLHKFIVADESHPRSSEIYAVLNGISNKLKLHGRKVIEEMDLVTFI